MAILFLRLVALFPLRAAHALGRLLGVIFFHSKNDLKKISRMNVRLCFPEMKGQQQDELAQEALKHVGMAIMECGALWVWSPGRIMNLVKQVSGEELLKSAMAKGDGVILVVPHLGGWEMVGLYVSHRYPMTSMYRPPRLAGTSQFVRSGREKMGAKLVPTDTAGIRALRKALSLGEVVAILPDQDPGKGAGVFAPFFNIQANTATLLSRLASKSGATVLVTYAERLPNGQGYHVHFISSPDCVADKDPVAAAGCLNRAVEQCARTLPAQYQWAYRRFRTRPEGEGKIYSLGRKEYLDLD